MGTLLLYFALIGGHVKVYVTETSQFMCRREQLEMDRDRGMPGFRHVSCFTFNDARKWAYQDASIQEK